MSDSVVMKDTSGNEVRIWQDTEFKEPTVLIWTVDKNSKLTAPKINLAQAAKIRNELDKFISKYTRIPTKEDLAEEVRKLKEEGSFICDQCTNDIDPTNVACSCGATYNFENYPTHVFMHKSNKQRSKKALG